MTNEVVVHDQSIADLVPVQPMGYDDAVRAAHPDRDVRYVPTLDNAASELARILQPGDLCLTLGAGDLTTLPDRFLGPAGAADDQEGAEHG